MSKVLNDVCAILEQRGFNVRESFDGTSVTSISIIGIDNAGNEIATKSFTEEDASVFLNSRNVTTLEALEDATAIANLLQGKAVSIGITTNEIKDDDNIGSDDGDEDDDDNNEDDEVIDEDDDEDENPDDDEDLDVDDDENENEDPDGDEDEDKQ